MNKGRMLTKPRKRSPGSIVMLVLVVAPIWWFVIPNLHKGHPLYRAITSGDSAALQERLSQHPDELEYRFYGLNATPLHLAAGRGDTPMVALLLQLGAEVDATGYRHFSTPLHSAAVGGHTPTVELLVAEGADVNSRDTNGKTPLHGAAASGHADSVEMLIRLGANINAQAQSYARTPLGEAAEFERVAAARILLEHGAEADLDALIERKRQDLAGVPLAQAEIKNEFRDLIAVLEEHRRKRATR